ncbi:MAG: hypothetical protein KGJ57_13900 [Sphingomonadales bacterium]|nr:hypothetical protein [Sphingomonadales bacterium]MDE2170497.1 hypothetical protein [Sphingomonadales bacterium]
MIQANSPSLRIRQALPALTLAIFVLMILIGLLVPLYTDEVGWRLQERAALDDVDKLFSEQCGPNTLAVPPWFMMPVRWYSGFFNTLWPAPLGIRVSGIGYALVWAGLLLMLIFRVTRAAARRRDLVMLSYGLMGLGVLPWLFIWSRPEQPIILAATGAILIALPPPASRAHWWRPLAILLLGTIAMAYHFKSLVLIPLFIVAIAVAMPMRRGWLIQAPCMAAMIAMSSVSAHYWLDRMACPNDPAMAAEHASQSLGLQLLTSNGWATAPFRLIANYNMPAYVAQAAPDITPMANWLPPQRVSKLTQILWTIGLILLWLPGFVLAVWSMVAAILRRQVSPEMLLAWGAFSAASAWCMSQIVRNSYEASFVLPLLILTFVLALSRQHVPARLPHVLHRVAALIACMLPLSALGIMAIYGSWLVDVSSRGGYLPGQSSSVGLAHYPVIRQQVERAAAACGITQAHHPQRLLLDDVTYFTFMQSHLPDHKNSVLVPRYSGRLTDPLAYLRQIRSSGVILGCSALPPALRARAHVDGQFCCISPDQWTTPQ